ncbi:Abi family protein [Mycoplasmopsis columbina]|uniref:Abi family protein n=1 Tax=Mycoplasmopsis columbina TaxID=114881 RepID=UPI0004A749A0|nr:Abi family protein [Mycoplasmopsis columbina]VEU76880.1 Abi family protein [Mycoplasmopsis columbina]
MKSKKNLNIKKFLTISQQIELLKSRNLIFTSENSENKNDEYRFKWYLRLYNYQDFVKGYNKIFVKNKIKKIRDENTSIVDYENSKSSGIIEIFNFDRSVSNYLFSNILNFERILKTSIVLAIGTTSKHKTIKNCRLFEIDKNEVANELFKNNLNKNEINKLFESMNSPFKENIQNNRLIEKYKDNKNIIPLWSLIMFWSFGTVFKFYSALKDEYKKEVLKNIFEKNENKRIDINTLEELIGVLKDIRNRIAHNNRIYDIKIQNKKKILNQLLHVNKVKSVKKPIKLMDLISVFELLIINKKNSNNKTLRELISDKCNTIFFQII